MVFASYFFCVKISLVKGGLIVVLKKPYGILIKHFRLIHVVIVGLLILILNGTSTIINFFQDYIANGYKATVVENMASQYISPILYLALILAIGLIAVIFVLLRYKKKPNQLYMATIVYYVLLLILVFVSANYLDALEFRLWDTETARLLRDVGNVVYYPQYIFIVLLAMRAFGFNVKKFNFKDDMRELELSDEDSEEVEININFQTYKAERKIRRLFREFKYYFLENKFIFICIGSVLFVVIAYFIITNIEKYNYNYKQNETFSYESLSYTIEDSIITNLNYAGEIINKNNYYLLLKVRIANPTGNEIEIPNSKFIVYSGDQRYMITADLAHHFIDYAEPYYGKSINGKDERVYLFVYTIPKDMIKKKFKISLYTGYTLKELDFRAKQINVSLNPIIVSDVSIVKNTQLNDPVVFNSTYLNETTLNIKSVEFTNKFYYNYESCVKDNCNTFTGLVSPTYSSTNQKTLMVLGYDYNPDKTVPYYKSYQTVNSFATNFFKIRYTIDNSVYVADIKDATPGKVSDKLVLELPSAVQNATKVDLLVTIRNKSYVINLVT